MSMQFCVAVAYLFSVYISFFCMSMLQFVGSPYCDGHLGYSCLVISCLMLLLTLPDPGTNVKVYF